MKEIAPTVTYSNYLITPIQGMKLPIYIGVKTENDKSLFCISRAPSMSYTNNNSTYCITSLKELEKAIGQLIAKYETL